MRDDLSGILVVDKAKAMTSHDVVKLVRRRFAIKKVGHAGTLDPSATGVLVLLLGKATKLSGRFLEEDKEYAATIKLGEKTDSADSDGNLILVREVRSSERDVKDTMAGFLGEMEQIPPMVSAKRVNGKRLYELARKGIEVKREPKRIVIKKLEIADIEIPFVRFRTVCSKGTYIRQLADDIGEKLGCGAHLTELKRLRSGSFPLEKAVPFSALLNMDRERLNESIIRI
ncbi:MAG: tRNA pseudouridine(55) synthase TruB [Candidatus Makaraimicrobium thalassicum]|nr:MAG: tRNA pseudouridine(55) synthase TruB [Candidatus Omnitrophota bacterium]